AHADVFKSCPFEDQISSFILKKGYELCMSSDGAGQGYSQVWIATEGDIFINLPEQLDKKNSFFRIVPWRWTSKKGTGGGDGKELLSAQWKYEWEPTGNSTANVEFVPMIKGRSQNKDYRWEQVRKRGRQTHMLGFNEPMAKKQGDLTVDEAIDLWPKEQMMGLRLGSPARTDGSNGDDWLKEFMQKAEAKGYRVDYVCVHCYNKNNATGLYNFLFTEYMKYGKPIWLTEFNSELTTLAAQEKYITEVTKMMEEAPFVERYAYFNSSEHKNFFNEDRTALTPLGEIYRDVKSNPAYVSPDYGKWLSVDLLANVTTDQLSANVAFSVDNNVIESVEYFINGVSVGSTSTAPFSLSPVAISSKLVSVRAVAKTVFGEQQSSNTVQLINQATGLNDAETTTVKLYPNPFNDRLYLSESAKWNLIDLQGKNIISGYGNEIKTTGLSDGMYVINVNNQYHKIIKSEHKTK
ncbi:MAG: glycosyl hydrolase, partial [Paludibacter sp.]|nr:glycosyl hydrolase [Paludibacter sp.]